MYVCLHGLCLFCFVVVGYHSVIVQAPGNDVMHAEMYIIFLTTVTVKLYNCKHFHS